MPDQAQPPVNRLRTNTFAHYSSSNTSSESEDGHGVLSPAIGASATSAGAAGSEFERGGGGMVDTFDYLDPAVAAAVTSTTAHADMNY